MKKNKTIIFGAGPSGIGVVCGIDENKKNEIPIIIEKNNRVGGLAGSFILDGDIIDYGPHRLAPTVKQVTKIAMEACGDDLLIQKSEHGVFIHKKLYQFPPQIFQWVNFKSLIFLSKTSISYLKSFLLGVFIKKKKSNFREIIINNFGEYFYKDIIDPMANKVWGSSDSLDTTFVKKRFSQLNPSEFLIKKIFNRKDLNPDNFYYPKNGFQQLWDDLCFKKLKNNCEIRLNTYPKEIFINSENTISEIMLNNGILKNLENDNIISTIPVIELIKCLKNFDTEIYEDKLKDIEIRSMMLLIVKLDQPRTLPYRTIIFPQNDVTFNRIFEQNLYSKHTVEKNKSVIVVDVTFDVNTTEKKINYLFEKSKKDILELEFVDSKKIISIDRKIIKYAYVSPTEKTKKAYEFINTELNKIKNLNILGRFGAGDYDNSDYAIESGINLANYLFANKDKKEYSELIKAREKNIIVG